MRVAGSTFRAIADKLGYRSVASAYESVARHLAANTPDDVAEQLRALELTRLDEMQAQYWPRAIRRNKPDYEAAAMIRWIMQHRARLLNLYREPALDAERFYRELREAARAEGLDEDEAVREAEGILRTYGRTR